MIRAIDDEVVLIWTTFPGDGDPAPLARRLVEEHLAACVTVQSGLRSVYRWEDGVEEASEQQVVIKTTSERVEQVRGALRQTHPYDLPELLVVPVAGDPEYLDWVRTSTRPPDDDRPDVTSIAKP